MSRAATDFLKYYYDYAPVHCNQNVHLKENEKRSNFQIINH